MTYANPEEFGGFEQYRDYPDAVVNVSTDLIRIEVFVDMWGTPEWFD
jgi:hypothetical protein